MRSADQHAQEEAQDACVELQSDAKVLGAEAREKRALHYQRTVDVINCIRARRSRLQFYFYQAFPENRCEIPKLISKLVEVWR